MTYLVRILLAFAVSLSACAPVARQSDESTVAPREIVLYTSLRETAVRPVIAPFEADTGATVRVVRARRPSTAEAPGLVAQFADARADVWWCQETLATVALKRAGAFARMDPPPSGADAIPSALHDTDRTWFGFAPRARIIMVNTGLVPADRIPRSMWDLLDPQWREKLVVAAPTGGTALFHFLALREMLGPDETDRFVDGLRGNACVVAPSDRRLAEMIGSGEAWVGMTDTSDCLGVRADGAAVDAIYPDQHGCGTLLIPHTVALLSTSADPIAARQLVEYLLSERAERILVQQGRGQLPLRSSDDRPAGIANAAELHVMPVDLTSAAARAGDLGPALRAAFPAPATDGGR